MKTALSIAGSDCSGGAGIQADIKTMLANKVYAMSAITALTAQNTMGVTAIEKVSPAFLGQQLDAIFEDIYPDAVKTGMVASKELIEVIAAKLTFYKAKNIVVDPVMVATSGALLISKDAIKELTAKLFTLATLITPNLKEAEIISGLTIENKEMMLKASKKIYDDFGCAVLCKGGHLAKSADDILFDGKDYFLFPGNKISNPNTHGTGCTLSSAIAANLAKGKNLETSIKEAKNYISSPSPPI